MGWQRILPPTIWTDENKDAQFGAVHGGTYFDHALGCHDLRPDRCDGSLDRGLKQLRNLRTKFDAS